MLRQRRLPRSGDTMVQTPERWPQFSAASLCAGLCAGLAGLLLSAALPAPVHAATSAGVEDRHALEARSRALTRASQALVGLQARAVAGARSARTLGAVREGSGVVIGADGLVLTIGYLVLEAERVDLTLDDGRRLPARVLLFDPTSGLGLVQALAPLPVAPVPLGDAATLGVQEPLTVASGGDAAAVSPAQLLARRAYAGSWEYHIADALFTSPPRRDHSGAGLFNARGELVGVGSLFLADAAGQGQPRQPGNMFVPVNLLQPLLAEWRAHGRVQPPERAWMGLNCAEQDGQVRVLRVADDSPADVAGLEAGDRILRIDGVAVSDLARLWQTLWSQPAAERAVTLEVQRGKQRLEITVHAVDRGKTLQRVQGI
jgi:S1-C subfamily serine protease